MKKEIHWNLQDDLGYTAIHQAVIENNYEAVIYLSNIKNINFNVSFSQLIL